MAVWIHHYGFPLKRGPTGDVVIMGWFTRGSTKWVTIGRVSGNQHMGPCQAAETLWTSNSKPLGQKSKLLWWMGLRSRRTWTAQVAGSGWGRVELRHLGTQWVRGHGSSQPPDLISSSNKNHQYSCININVNTGWQPHFINWNLMKYLPVDP